MPGSTHLLSALADEEAILAEVVSLVRAGVVVAEWPHGPRRALTLALFEAPVARAEARKQVALSRHLFGCAPDRLAERLAQPTSPSWQERRRAERVRADLSAHVGLRSGQGLLD